MCAVWKFLAPVALRGQKYSLSLAEMIPASTDLSKIYFTKRPKVSKTCVLSTWQISEASYKRFSLKIRLFFSINDAVSTDLSKIHFWKETNS